jgi:hypothetical protein
MRKLFYFLAITALLIPLNLQAKYNFEETVFFPLPHILSKWKVGYQQTRPDGSSITRYILENETMENWTQLVNVQFKDHRQFKCVDAVEAMKQEASDNRSVTYKVHSQAPDDLIFEKIFPTGEHELVRMILTKRGLHRIAYAKRDGPFTETDRSQWLDRLSRGTIERK